MESNNSLLDHISVDCQLVSVHPSNYVTPKFISVFGCLVILVLNETFESELEIIKYSAKKADATMSELK